MAIAKVAALNMPAESQRNFRILGRAASQMDSSSLAKVRTWEWVAIVRREAAPTTCRCRSGYRRGISPVARSELEYRGQGEQAAGHEGGEKVGRCTCHIPAPRITEEGEGQRRGAEHAGRQPGEVPEAHGQFRGNVELAPMVPEPCDGRHREESWPWMSLAGSVDAI